MNTSDKINEKISKYDDWRGDTLKELRALINETAPELTEDFKWNVPVWTQKGVVCAVSAAKEHVKLNFMQGVFLPNPSHLFNSGLDSKEHRSINLAKGDKLDKSALKELIRAAVAYNEGDI